jgi:[NiFe] hydrogenase assembly HybE family chaperone
MSPTPPLLNSRVVALEHRFDLIARTRMAGIPILNAKLAVRAVGFCEDADGAGAVGVLVTPWFMNLVWLPLRPAQAAPLAVGASRARRVGNECFDFIGADEPGFGPYEACSLFSPMFEFADQEAAVATARAVLDALRKPPPVQASRRALLLGRQGADGVR